MNPQGMTQPKASVPPGTLCGACLGAICTGTISTALPSAAQWKKLLFGKS